MTRVLLVILVSGFKTPIDIDPTFRPLKKTPTKVALLLPLQGEYKAISQAIQSGFSLANNTLSKPLSIIVINTKSYPTIQSSYQAAKRHRVDLIIGPLLKEEVAQLANYSKLQIPVLTLNYIPTIDAPANFYQFGLSPLDEIRTLTQEAQKNHYQSALIIAPNNKWGKKLALQCTRYWKKSNGKVTGLLYYNAQATTFTQTIRNFLTAHLNPQKEKGVDCIFLLASSEAGRQINPLLNFYLLSKIPIYSITSIYDQSLPDHLNRDLDRILICDTPWSIANNKDPYPTLKKTCSLKNPQHFLQHARYYALGVDALHLATQLTFLDRDSKKTIHGASGNLSINKNRYITRKTPCAQFQKGVLYALPPINEVINLAGRARK